MNWQEQAQQDGYIECDECGHVVELNHNTTGCDADSCGCTAAWTKTQIRQAHQQVGLTAVFDSTDLL